MSRLRVRRNQHLEVLRRKDVPVVGHGKRRPLERPPVELAPRLSVIEVLLNTRVNNELADSAAAKQLEELLVLDVVHDSDTRLYRDRQRRAIARVGKKRLEPDRVAQEAGALLL